MGKSLSKEIALSGETRNVFTGAIIMIINGFKVRDVVVEIEFTLTELQILKNALDNTELDISKVSDPDKKVSYSTTLNTFYDLISDAVEGAKKDGISL